MKDEFLSSLPQNGRWYDNTDNLYPTNTEPDTSSYSIQLSYNVAVLENSKPDLPFFIQHFLVFEGEM
jgi:hypothetical protein